jgi:hypothetical protein
MGDGPAAALYDLVDRHEAGDPLRRRPLHRRRSTDNRIRADARRSDRQDWDWAVAVFRETHDADGNPLGLCYTVFSEWLNTQVRQSWSYTQGDAPPAATRHGSLTPFCNG